MNQKVKSSANACFDHWGRPGLHTLAVAGVAVLLAACSGTPRHFSGTPEAAAEPPSKAASVAKLSWVERARLGQGPVQAKAVARREEAPLPYGAAVPKLLVEAEEFPPLKEASPTARAVEAGASPAEADVATYASAAIEDESLAEMRGGMISARGLGPETDEVAALAPSEVEDEELSEMRGAINIGGFELALGFILETALNGELLAQSVVNLTGADGGLQDLGAGFNNTVTVVNGNGGATQVIHQVGEGGVGSTVINSASGVTVDQTITLTVDVLNHTQFFSIVRSGSPLGAGPRLPNIMRDALIGAMP